MAPSSKILFPIQTGDSPLPCLLGAGYSSRVVGAQVQARSADLQRALGLIVDVQIGQMVGTAPSQGP